MNMLLVSSGLAAIKDFVGADPATLKLLFVPTAGNPYKNTWWIDKDKAVLGEMGFQITEFDFANKTNAEMQNVLSQTDVLYIAGGNTFYLLDQLQKTGFDTLIIEFVTKGGLYAGGSAGAIIMGPDIEMARDFDDPDHLYNLASTSGLNLVSFIPFPHYDMADRTENIDQLVTKYSNKYTIITMTDDEAIHVDGSGSKIVSSQRTAIELNWPKS